MAMAGRRKRVEDVVSVEKEMEEDAWKNPNVRKVHVIIISRRSK